MNERTLNRLAWVVSALLIAGGLWVHYSPEPTAPVLDVGRQPPPPRVVAVVVKVSGAPSGAAVFCSSVRRELTISVALACGVSPAKIE